MSHIFAWHALLWSSTVIICRGIKKLSRLWVFLPLPSLQNVGFHPHWALKQYTFGSYSVTLCCTNHVLCFDTAKTNHFLKFIFFVFTPSFPLPISKPSLPKCCLSDTIEASKNPTILAKTDGQTNGYQKAKSWRDRAIDRFHCPSVVPLGFLTLLEKGILKHANPNPRRDRFQN